MHGRTVNGKVLKKGREEGREQGRNEEKIEIAIKMIGLGLDLKSIEKLTGLSEDKIIRLIQNKILTNNK